jgi:CRP-like cAMP-binding protein/predicted MFS family arabinose efflux permease
MAHEERAGRFGWLTRYRSALSRRDLRRLLGAELVSSTGSWAYNVALLAFVYDRTHSLGWVGGAGLVRLIPQLLLSPYGGVLAERTERIRLMVASDLLSAAFQAGLVIVAASQGPPAVALALAGLTSISGVVYQPATAATIPALVDEDDLTAANALNGLIDQLVVIAGPAIGALLLLAGSPSVVFAVNAVSFLGSAALVSRIGVRSQPVDISEGEGAGPLRQVLVGIRTIAALPAARTLVAYCALVSFLYGTDTVLFVGVSAHKLGTGAEGFGYLLAGLGVGGILIAGAVDRIAASPRLAAIILAGALGYALPTALLTVIHAPALAFAVEIVRGGATLVVDVLAITVLQRAVPSDQLARVFGVFFALVLAAIALGTVLTPVIVRAFGLDAALWIMALGPVPFALAGYPALRRTDLQAASRATALEPRVALLESLGLFAGASRPVLERLAAAATTETYAPATAIVREGDPADALYVLAQGEVQVSARGKSGGTGQPIEVLRSPAYFGEIGLLEAIARTATVTALSECRCERIAGETFLEALTTSPPSTALMETARSRLAVTLPSRQIGSATTARTG